MTRYCMSCGSPLDEGVSFCTVCGAPVVDEDEGETAYGDAAYGDEAAYGAAASDDPSAFSAGAAPAGPTCPQCGAPLDPGAAFCVYCGAPVDSAASMTMPLPVMPDGGMGQQGASAAPPGSYPPEAPAWDPAYAGNPAYGGGAQGGSKSSMVLYTVGIVAAAVAVTIAIVIFTKPFGLGQTDGGGAQPVVISNSDSGDSEYESDSSSGDSDWDSSSDDEGYSSSSQQSTTEESEPSTSEPVVDHSKGVNRASENDDYYVLPESSTRVYSASELSGLSAWDLKVARNEIFARYGRGFNNEALQDYFNSKSWYVRRYSPEEFDDMPEMLTDTERDNIKVIKSLEPDSNFK